MNKKTTANLAITCIILLILSLVYYFKFYYPMSIRVEDSIEEVDSTLISYMSYDTAEDLINGSELIVIASTSLTLEERSSITKYMDTGVIGDYYTLTEIYIKTILKEPRNFQLNTENKIEIIEPSAMVTEKGKKVLYKRDSYYPLLPNNDYIIFLKANSKNIYGVINMYRGKFNLSVDEETSTALRSFDDYKKSKYLKLKKDVAEKFSLEIKEKN